MLERFPANWKYTNFFDENINANFRLGQVSKGWNCPPGIGINRNRKNNPHFSLFSIKQGGEGVGGYHWSAIK